MPFQFDSWKLGCKYARQFTIFFKSSIIIIAKNKQETVVTNTGFKIDFKPVSKLKNSFNFVNKFEIKFNSILGTVPQVA